MGYCYGQNESGRWVLACDKCGNVGGVRKRTCPHKVLMDSHRTPDGTRYALPYCSAPALCASCYQAEKATLHADCKAGAAASQVEYDAIEAGFDAGRLRVASASGDWKEGVPAGMVEVTFSGRGNSNPVVGLVLDEDYRPGAKPWMDQYEVVVIAVEPTLTKQV